MKTAEKSQQIQKICADVTTFKSVNEKDCGLALYNELISANFHLTEDDAWKIVDELGCIEETLTAIICAKIISTKSMFTMLRVTSFNINLCLLALDYDSNAELYTKVMRAIERKGLIHFKAFLSLKNGVRKPPFDSMSKIHPIVYQSQAHCYHA